MRPLMLDYQRFALPGGAAWLLLGAGVLLSAAAVLAFADINRELPVWEAQAARSNHGVHNDISLRNSEAVRHELKQANLILQQLALPWDALFAALEATGGEKVALLSVEPDVAKGMVRIGAEAKSAEHMLNYLRRMEQNGGIGAVVLLNHQIQSQDPDRPLRFSVAASWGGKP
jgi:hypothetical protein